ncbi:MAG: hypothetical protein M3Q39_01710 [Actinomycetota bacterium]|nr:hypothetical protein [Actinomycetota bacterium]
MIVEYADGRKEERPEEDFALVIGELHVRRNWFAKMHGVYTCFSCQGTGAFILQAYDEYHQQTRIKFGTCKACEGKGNLKVRSA